MNDEPDLAAVAADGALLDALADGTATEAQVEALAGLGELRAALDADLGPLMTPETTADPAPVPAAAVGEVVGLRRPTARRSGRRVAAVVAGAALALSSTGAAAAAYTARPGDALYGLRTAVAGPRAEDPGVLAERLDTVQRQLEAPDAVSRDAARQELAEVAALLEELDPELRAGLDRRHAVLRDRLTAVDPAAPAGPPTVGGEPGRGEPGPPGADRTPPSRPETSRGKPSPKGPTRPAPPTADPSAPPSANPSAPPSADPSAPPSARPGRPDGTPGERPGPSRSAQPGRPSPRDSQGAGGPERSREPGKQDGDRRSSPNGSASPEPTG